MNVFYEEDGGFKVGAVLSETEASCQVEATHGKRSKIKSSAIFFRFDAPPLSAFIAGAEANAARIELDFLWEVAPDEEFGYTELGSEYYGHAPAPVEAAALLMRLHGAPMHFYKKGRGRYKAAPAESLKAALASVERKQREAELQAQYAAQLARFEMPAALAGNLGALLYKPDKQSIGYRALESACAVTGLPAPRLLHRAGALGSARDYFYGRFVFEHFPRGAGFAAHAAPRLPEGLPLAPGRAFSIDDASTTEIDDAFSVRPLTSGQVRIGIHIAAPTLGFDPGEELDAIAHARMSTVYMPGAKITMLPDDAVDAFTLAAGRTVPCVSLYVDVEPADLAIAHTESRVEVIAVAANLRHHELDEVITAEALAAGSGDYPFKEEIALLWRFANKLEADRGKPSMSGKFRDYNFRLEDPPAAADGASGNPEPMVTITERRRGAPLDKLVSELMILANHTWGRLLADRGASGIYRVKTGAGPAGKVRMTSVPAAHIGLGVTHYAWSSSPLRRYVDLVNQWQLIAVLGGGKPPFAAKSEALLGAIAMFDAAYAAYAAFQDTLERYWCLRWLAQQGWVGSDRPLVAVVLMREGMALLDGIPLAAQVAGLPVLAGGTRIHVLVRGIDEWDLSADLAYAGLVDPPAAGGVAEISAAVDEAEENTD